MPQPPCNFLGLEMPLCDPAAARYAVLPVPYEKTVSYKTGTAEGPSAILDASRQVEFYDDELRAEFIRAGVATLPAIEPVDPIEAMMEAVRRTAEPVLRGGKFLLSLGGEHSITPPLVAAAAEVHGELGVLQIDAHSDLRDSYQGTRHSHACAMRRVLEITPRLCQVGIRSFPVDDVEQCPRQVERFITPARMAAQTDWIDQVVEMLGPKAYLTVDIDGLDPSIAPGTGTPEPGGLSWAQTLALVRAVCTRRHVVAADIVEVRPIPPNHITEFLAARLAYKIIAYTQL